MKRSYWERETTESITVFLRNAKKTKHTMCPLCKRARNVYGSRKGSVRKICSSCEITWVEASD